MILAIDTSSAACTAALFDGQQILASRTDIIGRGHSERLVPMLHEMLEDRVPETVLVGVGPGSFTGIRVGIAAAQGLSIGWGATLFGMSSLALLAAGEEAPLAVAVKGGHGELLVQQFDAIASPGPMQNLVPTEAASVISARRVIGSGAASLVEARGFGEALDALPSAAHALRVPEKLRMLPATPVYSRAPDAIPRAAA